MSFAVLRSSEWIDLLIEDAWQILDRHSVAAWCFMFMLQGASVIRMLEDFLGEEEFKNGITNFLNHFKFANAVTQDLWEELQQVQKDVNITRVMDTWTRQMGYPVVTATRGSNGTVTLQQTRFLSDPDATATDSSPYG